MPLRTIRQVAGDEGLTVSQVRRLVEEGRLEFIHIGSRKLIPEGAFERFMVENTVKVCRDEIPVPGSASSISGAASISPGLSAAAAGSARWEQAIAARLKAHSRGSSENASAEPARVIPMRSS